MFYESLQPVLVEGPPDVRGVDHNQRLLMFGRPAAKYNLGQSFWKNPSPYVDVEADVAVRTDHNRFILMFGGRVSTATSGQQFPILFRPLPRPWVHNEDKWQLAYSVTEAYSQQAQPSGNPVSYFANFTTSRPQAFEDAPDIRHADHSILFQFRWTIIGILTPYTFEVPDLNDYPWLEWPVQRGDKGNALFPFRQFSTPAQVYQPSLVFWKPRFWDLVPEPDTQRIAPHNERLLMFGRPQVFTPPVQITMPDLTGMQLPDAVGLLISDGLFVGGIVYWFGRVAYNVEPYQAEAIVLTQSVAPGASVSVGTQISMTVTFDLARGGAVDLTPAPNNNHLSGTESKILPL